MLLERNDGRNSNRSIFTARSGLTPSSSAMRGFESRIQEVFSDVRKEWIEKSNANVPGIGYDGWGVRACDRRLSDCQIGLRFQCNPHGLGVETSGVSVEYQNGRRHGNSRLCRRQWNGRSRLSHFMHKFLPAHTIEEDDLK